MKTNIFFNFLIYILLKSKESCIYDQTDSYISGSINVSDVTILRGGVCVLTFILNFKYKRRGEYNGSHVPGLQQLSTCSQFYFIYTPSIFPVSSTLPLKV